jgi:hypothetical protein
MDAWYGARLQSTGLNSKIKPNFKNKHDTNGYTKRAEGPKAPCVLLLPL